MSKHLNSHKSRPFTDPRDTWQHRARQSAEAKTGKVQDAAPRRRTGRIVDSNSFVYVDRVTYTIRVSDLVMGTTPLDEFKPGDVVECEGQVRVVAGVDGNPYWGNMLGFDDTLLPAMCFAHSCKLVGGPW